MPTHRKHCNPIGIPTIVMHQMQPMESHKSPIKMPPNNHHKIFPNNLILSLLLQFFYTFLLRLFRKSQLHKYICFIFHACSFLCDFNILLFLMIDNIYSGADQK